jgi:anti-sigma factor RsiW
VDHDKIRANLSAYKDNELSGSFRDQIALHLQGCETCCEELRKLDRIDALVRELPQISAAENFASGVISKAQAASAPGHHIWSLPHRILDRFLFLGDSVFGLFRGFEAQEGALDEFGDSPPLSLSHAYFQLIDR